MNSISVRLGREEKNIQSSMKKIKEMKVYQTLQVNIDQDFFSKFRNHEILQLLSKSNIKSLDIFFPDDVSIIGNIVYSVVGNPTIENLTINTPLKHIEHVESLKKAVKNIQALKSVSWNKNYIFSYKETIEMLPEFGDIEEFSIGNLQLNDHFYKILSASKLKKLELNCRFEYNHDHNKKEYNPTFKFKGFQNLEELSLLSNSEQVDIQSLYECFKESKKFKTLIIHSFPSQYKKSLFLQNTEKFFIKLLEKVNLDKLDLDNIPINILSLFKEGSEKFHIRKLVTSHNIKEFDYFLKRIEGLKSLHLKDNVLNDIHIIESTNIKTIKLKSYRVYDFKNIFKSLSKLKIRKFHAINTEISIKEIANYIQTDNNISSLYFSHKIFDKEIELNEALKLNSSLKVLKIERSLENILNISDIIEELSLILYNYLSDDIIFSFFAMIIGKKKLKKLSLNGNYQYSKVFFEYLELCKLKEVEIYCIYNNCEKYLKALYKNRSIEKITFILSPRFDEESLNNCIVKLLEHNYTLNKIEIFDKDSGETFEFYLYRNIGLKKVNSKVLLKNLDTFFKFD